MDNGKRLSPLGYYKWHWQTWRANRTVQRMSYVERGLYRELLDECWAEGFIPDDIEKLADICGCPVDVMANAWQMLGKCFANAGNGFLYNERLEQERTDMDKTRANRARAGAAGGNAKASNGAGRPGKCFANASESQANASKCHIEEKRREENKKTLSSGDDVSLFNPTKKPATPIPYDEIFDVYEEVLCKAPHNRPSVKLRDDKRKAAIKKIIKARPKAIEPGWWQGYFGAAASNDHWMQGDKHKGGTWPGANFDFLLRDDVFKKILEDNV